jgi:acetoin:2,6-dichlorophenolindophenol oxidoreductase subunit alpha
VLARVERLEGHFLGDPLVRIATDVRELGAEVVPLVRSMRGGAGASTWARARALSGLTRTIGTATLDAARPRRDPLLAMRRRLPAQTATLVERAARAEVDDALRAARLPVVRRA